MKGKALTSEEVKYGSEVVVGLTPLPELKLGFVSGVHGWRDCLVKRCMGQRFFTHNCGSTGVRTKTRKEKIPMDC